MTLRGRLASLVLVVFATAAPAGWAQRLDAPLPSSWQVADSLLPVVDDSGRVITEAEIQSRLRSGDRTRFFRIVLGFALGAFVVEVMTTPKDDADCSIYEPCTGREKFLEGHAVLIGAVTGAFIGGVAPAGVNRAKAVERIRLERRVGPPPP